MNADRNAKSPPRCDAETGCTQHRIAVILGHQTLSEVERHTRAADQKRLAQTAQALMPQHQKEKANG